MKSPRTYQRGDSFYMTIVFLAHPYLVPVLEEMNYRLNDNRVESYRESGLIEICPLEYMRGRNFHDSFMILDEAQNS